MKKCKHCKEPFEQVHWNQKYCFKIECKQVWFAEAWKKEKAKRKRELQTLPEALENTQKIFNHYIRLRDHGQVCISCRQKPKKENGGHFFSAGGHSNVRFDPLNVHLQCEPCNNNLSGNIHKYRIYLIEKIGQDAFDDLESRAYITKKWTRDELNEIVTTYGGLIKKLKSELKLK
jgi:hypothetical protein